MNKLTNDQNIKNLKKRKILRYLIIALGIITIVLSILSLIIKWSFIFPLITFLLMTILTKKRESIPIKLSKSIETKRIEKAIKKQKEKKK
ncbi:MAG: hypothetical protein IJO43_02605 [Bacilli bacterium]|nr:hypothetical protein [Bacilli bacterium]